MTMDVSSLGIEVKSTGISEASRALSGLGTSAANAEAKVAKLTDTVERLLKQPVTATMQAWASAMNQMASTIGNIGSGAQSYGLALSGATQAAAQSINTTNTLNQQFNQQNNILTVLTQTVNNYGAATAANGNAHREWTASAGVMLNTLKAMTTAFLYYKTIALAKSIVEDADAFTNLNAKLVVSTGSQHNATIAMRDMFDVSQTLRTSLESTAELFARMNLIMQRTGNDYQTVKTTVTGLAAALHLYGATTGESSSAMLAYAHSASTGVVHMRTLNSLMTSAPLLLQAFQDATGKSGEELRKMSTKGQLTFEMLNKALYDATPKFLEQFERIPMTFQGAMQRLENSWFYAMGKLGQDTGFNTALAHSVKVIEDLIPGIAKGLADAFITVMHWIEQNKQGLIDMGTQFKGIITDVMDIAKDLGDVARNIVGAGEDASALALVFEGIRYTLALIADAFKVITGLVGVLGGVIGVVILTPMSLAVTVLGYLIEGLGKLYAGMAKIHELEGNKEQAGRERQTAQFYADLGTTLEGTTKTIAGTSVEAFKMGKTMLGAVMDGDSALGRLNASLEKSKQGLQGMTEAEQESQRELNRMSGGYHEDPIELAIKKRKAEAEAAAEAMKKYQDAYDKEVNKNLQQVAALRAEYDKLMATQRELQDGPHALKVGPAQSEYLSLLEKRKAVEGEVNIINKQQILSDIDKQIKLAAVNAEVERYNELLQKQDQSQKKQLDKEVTLLGTINDQVKALQERNEAFRNPNGKADATGEKIDSIQAKADAAQAQLSDPGFIEAASTTAIEHQRALLKTYNEQIEALKQLQIEEHVHAQNLITEEWDKMFDDKKTTKFTDAMTKGFGQAGKAVAGLANALRTAAEQQDKLSKAQQLVNETDDPIIKHIRQQQLAEAQNQAMLDTYANMTEALQGFFKKGTAGYKIMGDAEKAFRLAEMAMAVESFAVKTGLINAETVAAIGGYIKTALASQESAAVQIASALGLGPVLAALGVATQAQGDPYTAWARMAAMAAVMAALGFAVSGGAGSGAGAHLAADRQAAAGTGTSLGDATKQSDSISKSMDVLSKNSDLSLRYSAGMLSALQSIQAALEGTASQIVRSSGNLTGAGYQGSKIAGIGAGVKTGLEYMLTGGLSGGLTFDSIANSFAKASGFGTNKKLVDAGITSGTQTLGQIESQGFTAKAYQDIETQKKAFWTSYSDKISRSTTTLDPAVNNSFTKIIDNMATTVESAGKALGMSSDEIKAKLAQVQVSLGDISLKGLTADQIEKQLETVFSAFGDKLVSAGLGDQLTKFQQAGEGLLQTATRVAAGVDQARVELDKLGVSAINFQDVVNTSGDIGAEIVRQSIMVKEAGTGIGDIINTMSGTAQDIGDAYTGLKNLRTSLVDLGVAKDITADLLSAAGGMQAFQSALDSYKKNFFSASEQQAMDVKDVAASFQALGLQMPTTRAGFRSLVEQLSASGDSGQALAAKVILLSDSFNNLFGTVDSKVSDATSALTDAYNNQANAIQSAKTAFDGFVTTLKAFHTSLVTGDLSTSNALTKYQTEKALYEQTQAKAMAGDQTAIGNFQQIAQDFLKASRDVYASGDQYTQDYQKVLQQTDALEQYAGAQSNVQDQQLAALNQQVSGLITINTSVLTVVQAIKNLQDAMAQGLGSVPTTTGAGTGDGKSTILPVTGGTHYGGLSMVPYDNYHAILHAGERVLTATENRAYQQSQGGQVHQDMVTELKALRAEVANLRADQQMQTQALVAATHNAAEENAEAVCDSQKQAAEHAAYAKQAKAVIA